MTGHIVKKAGRWYLVLDYGQDPDTGKRVRKSVGGFAKERDAKDELDRRLGDAQRGIVDKPQRLTVAEFLRTKWLPAARGTVRVSTFESYQRLMEAHVIPRIGGVQLKAVDGAVLNQLYAELAESGRRAGNGNRRNAGPGLSPASVRLVHTVLHRAFRDAVRWNLLARNPGDAADPPRAQRPEMKVWDAGELGAFLTAMEQEGDPLYAAYVLAATTGMRRGEVLGLRWQDVDLDASRLSVSQTLVALARGVAFSEPKTKRSRRRIALDPATVAVLRAHRARQLEYRMALGLGQPSPGDLVFVALDGASPVHPRTLTRTFERRAKRLGLPRLSFHGLRHSYATVALTLGVHPKVVSERVGHSTIAITLDTYSHVIESVHEDAAATVAAAIFTGR